jgi:regulator of protease activity HflC (stomatin/prohibitin superfamily)
MTRRNAPNNIGFNYALYLTGGIVLLFVAILFKPFAIVNAGERGVMMRLGKVQDTVLDEGVHPILPIITSVKRLSVRVQKNDFQSDAASKDLQKVTTDLAINWHVDPRRANRVYQQVGDET